MSKEAKDVEKRHLANQDGHNKFENKRGRRGTGKTSPNAYSTLSQNQLKISTISAT